MIKQFQIKHLTIKHFNYTNYISTYNLNILLYTTIKYKANTIVIKTLQKETLQKETLQQNNINQNISNKTISNKTFNYKATLKTFKRVFNSRLYLCITNRLFCLIGTLKAFYWCICLECLVVGFSEGIFMGYSNSIILLKLLLSIFV